MDLITYALAKKALASGGSSGDTGILIKIQNDIKEINEKINENSDEISKVNEEVQQVSTTMVTDILPTLSRTVSAIKIGNKILTPVNNILELQIGTGDVVGTPEDSEDAINKISIKEDKTMEVNSLSSDKLVSGEEVLIFNSNYEKYFN